MRMDLLYPTFNNLPYCIRHYNVLVHCKKVYLYVSRNNVGTFLIPVVGIIKFTLYSPSITETWIFPHYGWNCINGKQSCSNFQVFRILQGLKYDCENDLITWYLLWRLRSWKLIIWISPRLFYDTTCVTSQMFNVNLRIIENRIGTIAVKLTVYLCVANIYIHCHLSFNHV